MSLIDPLFVRQVRLLKIKPILRILIISIGITNSVNAQSLDKYCLSTVGQIEEITKTKAEDQTRQLPPFIDSIENLPELYENPCDQLTRFCWGCDHKTFINKIEIH